MRLTTALNPLCLSAVYSTMRVVPSGSAREYAPVGGTKCFEFFFKSNFREIETLKFFEFVLSIHVVFAKKDS